MQIWEQWHRPRLSTVRLKTSRKEKKEKKKKMQPREDSTAWVLVPGSVPARVLLLYGYFVRSQRHFNVEVQLELQVRRESGRHPGSSSRKTEAKRWHRPVSGMNGLPPKRTQGKGWEDWGWGLAKERPVFQTGKGHQQSSLLYILRDHHHSMEEKMKEDNYVQGDNLMGNHKRGQLWSLIRWALERFTTG